MYIFSLFCVPNQCPKVVVPNDFHDNFSLMTCMLALMKVYFSLCMSNDANEKCS